MFAGIRRASSRVISLVAARRQGSSIRKRLAVLILHDEAGPNLVRKENWPAVRHYEQAAWVE